MIFALPKLSYAYDALQPVIDTQTMTIHHTKHHQGYTNKLNAAIADTPYADRSITDLLTKLDQLPDTIRGTVRNNGGGYYNHDLFWQVMIPGGTAPSAAMLQRITESFGSLAELQAQFAAAAKTQFGSGWARVCIQADGSLHVCATPNQDNPLMPQVAAGTPILGLDIREHAYYLNYQNKRADYVDARWPLINREQVEKNMNA